VRRPALAWLALASVTACVQNPFASGSGGTSGGTSGGAGAGGSAGGPPVRDASFAQLPIGSSVNNLTIGGLDMQLTTFNGSSDVEVLQVLGDRNIAFECGAVRFTAPEGHSQMGMLYNDDHATIQAQVYDTTGNVIAQFDTQNDAASLGVKQQGNYKQIMAKVAPASGLIGSVVLGSCAAYLHELALD
jgi:YD repeat-containing protein